MVYYHGVLLGWESAFVLGWYTSVFPSVLLVKVTDPSGVSDEECGVTGD